MKKFLFSAAIAASALTIPAAAQAQQRPPILIVDTDTIMSTCTACAAAKTQLVQKEAALRSRAQTLRQQLQTEGKPIQEAIDKLGDKQPDAALQNRVKAFQQKQQQANQELETSQTTLQSTAAHVQQQIGDRLIAIVEQVRARRGALVAMSKGQTLANDTSVDVTSEVLAALNQQLPAVSITPMPQQQQPAQQQPQGR
jgi:Skp family chaperone for outer membrane proteins